MTNGCHPPKPAVTAKKKQLLTKAKKRRERAAKAKASQV